MIDAKKLHVAIIMDGNGRWAQERGLPRLEGHFAGARAVERTVEAAVEAGLGTLTLYAFSTENWRRPANEVSGLLKLLRFFLYRKRAKMIRNGVRLRWLGRRDRVPPALRRLFEEVEHETAGLDRMTLVLAVDYGGRWEMAQAALRMAERLQNGAKENKEDIEKTFGACLESAWLPEVDLLIRTSGEQRVSNFLPWHASYAELYFTPTFWPEFDGNHLQAALAAFKSRTRRYGCVPTAKQSS
jgi:undecaprenyl diphosphate synthase